MASELQQREAALRRLNDEIDVDTRAVLSSADAVLATSAGLPVGHGGALMRKSGGWLTAREPSPRVDDRAQRVASRSSGKAMARNDRALAATSHTTAALGSRATSGAATLDRHTASKRGAHPPGSASDSGDACVSVEWNPADIGYSGAGVGACDNLQHGNVGGGVNDGDVAAVAAAAGVGAEAMVRLLRTKLAAVEAAAKEAQNRNFAMQQEMAELRRQLQAESEERKFLAKQLQQLQQQHERQRQQRREDESAATANAVTAADLRKELLDAQKAAQAADADRKAVEVRLNRTAAEAERLRGAAEAAKGAGKDRVDEARHDVTRLKAQVRRLERQKAELLSAFRKQLRLIDVLRRQKDHLEAARLLAFTEEEFVRTLEWAA